MKQSISSLVHQLNVDMDRVADRTLSLQAGISYSRFYCLFHILQSPGTTQHKLAVAMGFSDAAISTMLAELKSDGLVEITVDPQHLRRRNVRLTRHGKRTTEHCLELLDACFADVIKMAGIDEAAYAASTHALRVAMQQKIKEGK